MELPEVGLVIDEPYISQILSGEKTWEMRSSRTGKRQVIGLIKKSTKHVFGTAELYACEGPLSYEQLMETTNKHGIPANKVEEGFLSKWNYAWKLRNVVEFDKPIPYDHPSGAVTWVKLEQSTLTKRHQPLNTPTIQSSEKVKPYVRKSPQIVADEAPKSIKVAQGAIPYAKDGTGFTPELAKNGFFTVGEKGAEQKIGSYEEALHYLRKMDKAKWRRPNNNGNWGIVSAVSWK